MLNGLTKDPLLCYIIKQFGKAKMGVISSRTKQPSLFLIMVVLLSIITFSASAANSAHNTFLHCLVNHSESSHPIASAIFTTNNASFSSVLQAHIRNLRFNTSTTRKPFLINCMHPMYKHPLYVPKSTTC